MRRSLFLILAAACATVGAQPASAAQDPPADAAEALPIGNGAEFRARLLSWQAPPSPRSAVPVDFRLPTVVTLISSRFGVRGDPLGGAARMHAGIDLPDRFGAPVASSADGIVVRAGWAHSYGNMVEVDHGEGVHTRYAHLSRVLVSAGQPIAGGDIVGLVGSTGRSTGNHLHFEVRENGRATDPLTFAWQPAPQRSDPVVPVRQRRGGWKTVSGETRLPMPSLD